MLEKYSYDVLSSDRELRNKVFAILTLLALFASSAFTQEVQDTTSSSFATCMQFCSGMGLSNCQQTCQRHLHEKLDAFFGFSTPSAGREELETLAKTDENKTAFIQNDEDEKILRTIGTLALMATHPIQTLGHLAYALPFILTGAGREELESLAKVNTDEIKKSFGARAVQNAENAVKELLGKDGDAQTNPDFLS